MVIQIVSSGDRRSLTIVSAILLFIGASGMFRHLKVALNLILDVPAATRKGRRRFLVDRAVALVMVVGALVGFVAAAVLTASMALARRMIPDLVAGDVILWRIVDFVALTVTLALVFTLILKYVPDIGMKWRHVLLGAIPGALAVSLGRLLLTMYLGRTQLTDIYGAAASLFVILTAIFFRPSFSSPPRSWSKSGLDATRSSPRSAAKHRCGPAMNRESPRKVTLDMPSRIEDYALIGELQTG